ncbi:MAG: Archaeal histone A [Candidatus Heimdallarchaeota archaeon LC_3]|nr:MAG: Archaeal histone A [Candidatus Heimdallarchaeota archaeon LC_3]
MSKKGKKAAPAAAKSSRRRSSRSKGQAFASAKVEKLIREAGAFRVSSGAIKALNDLLGERGLEVARYSVEIARNSGRRTIKETDVTLSASK